MNNAKWVVFGCCFLALMAALGVYWAEQKIAQVTATVNGAVESVEEAVYAPVEAASTALGTLDKNASQALRSFNGAVADAMEPHQDAIHSFFSSVGLE